MTPNEARLYVTAAREASKWEPTLEQLTHALMELANDVKELKKTQVDAPWTIAENPRLANAMHNYTVAEQRLMEAIDEAVQQEKEIVMYKGLSRQPESANCKAAAKLAALSADDINSLVAASRGGLSGLA